MVITVVYDNTIPIYLKKICEFIIYTIASKEIASGDWRWPQRPVSLYREVTCVTCQQR
jgi:hypothetical protein